ncbi:hypothetical protein [Leucothrix arctica]|uniref:Lipoprotein n=1 Tax=Leucothrix arctica TaxID=1481894 RepID=A0A317C6F4_9GAMM|nr:hypothetical protein [Leucothrix arctica]PWQ93781.1 hypothetical protein DKT75_19445 [Leucothrix arctica]
MKKIITIMCLVAVSGLTACTQYQSLKHEKQKEQMIENSINATDPSERALIITTKMVEVLSLNEVQKVKVMMINEDFSTRYNILAESTNPKLNKREEFIKLTNEKDIELKKVLNNAQITKWHAVSAEFWEEYRIV